jgi:uncharacterized protein involved in propanediol utilization
MKTGHGFAHAHHGEILQGVFRSNEGVLKQGLITLPCGIFRSKAHFFPDNSGDVHVSPADRWKTRRAAELALRRLDLNGVGGLVEIHSRIPEKLGLGSSTSNVVAAIRAVADAFSAEFTLEDIAAISVEAEGASDPIFFENRFVLFAQREGEIIHSLPHTFPEFEILGFNLAHRGEGVDTLALPVPSYTTEEVERFRELFLLFQRGLGLEDLALLGEVATESARMNQKYLCLEGFPLVEKIAERSGALGVQIAHSGSVAGLMFPPGGSYSPEAHRGLGELRRELGIENFWRFHTGAERMNRSGAHPKQHALAAGPNEFV